MRLSSISVLTSLFLSVSTLSSIPALSSLSLKSLKPAEVVRASFAASVPFEEEPWRLSSIEIFESSELASASNQTTGHSYIVFNITDSNPQLEFNTACRYDAPDGTPTPATPGSGYGACGHPDVKFKYDGTKIDIMRTYSWPEPGTPLGREYVLCFGDWNTSLHDFHTNPPNPPGVRRIQGCMEIYCTKMAS